MNLSKRSKLSLCQVLDLFAREVVATILAKHELDTEGLNPWDGEPVPELVCESIFGASAAQLANLVDEIVRTRGSMRFQISPKYVFDERWDDLVLCFELDNYRLEYVGPGRQRFVTIEPAIEGVDPVDNSLTRELRQSGLLEADEIIRTLEASANLFRAGDMNGCLSKARIALETLALSI